MFLNVAYREKCVGVGHGEDEYEYRDFTVTGVGVNLPGDPFEINTTRLPKKVFVLVVRYQTGSTFGRIYGNGHVEGVYTRRDYAEKLRMLIERGDGAYQKHKAQKLRERQPGDKPVYVPTPWIGYFESLEWVEIREMEVQP